MTAMECFAGATSSPDTSVGGLFLQTEARLKQKSNHYLTYLFLDGVCNKQKINENITLKNCVCIRTVRVKKTCPNLSKEYSPYKFM